MTQGYWYRGRKARERKGRGLTLPLALLLLQRKLVHVITYPIAAIITPIMAFLTPIVALAGLTTTGHSHMMGVVCFRGHN